MSGNLLWNIFSAWTPALVVNGLILGAPNATFAQSGPPPVLQVARDAIGVRLIVPRSGWSGYVQHSTNLVDWMPWAAFVPGSNDLVHTIAAPAGQTNGGPTGFFRIEPGLVAVPTNFVFVAPGDFLMGSAEGELDRWTDENQHVATVHRGFWIARTEVTVREWLEVMPEFPRERLHGTSPDSAANNMSWPEANEFCRRLTVRDAPAGRIPAGSAYRLPTETEWEYAARAGTQTRFFWGDDPDYSQLKRYAWYGENARSGIQRVGQLLPNPLGLYDIHGNVFEWCLDPDTPFPGSTRILLPRRMYRGGSYYCPNWVLRVAHRAHTGDPELPDHLAGVRLVIGYAPDSLRTVKELAPPVPRWTWNDDHTVATVVFDASPADALVEFARADGDNWSRWSVHDTPLVFTNAVRLKARALKPATVLSPTVLVRLERAAPPAIEVADGRIVLWTGDGGATIQVRATSAGPWSPYWAGQRLEPAPGLAARCWHPDKFVSDVIDLSLAR